MASKHLPKTELKLPQPELRALVRVMHQYILEDAPIHSENNNFLMLWAINKGIVNEWLKQCEREQKQPYTLNLDVVQMIAMLEYWDIVSFPPYEETAMRKVLTHLHRALQNQRSKKI